MERRGDQRREREGWEGEKLGWRKDQRREERRGEYSEVENSGVTDCTVVICGETRTRA